MRRFVMLVLVSLLAPALTLVATGPAGGAVRLTDRDCADFATQAQAQSFFLANDPASDPHRLDEDGDGRACESLPCPCSTGDSPPPAPATVRQGAIVLKVVDGDTIDVRLVASGVRKRVRLIGINSPELDRCGYARATRSLRGLLPLEVRVTLVSDPTQPLRDGYGRLLRYVERSTRDINRAQVYLGVAKVFVVGREFKRVDGYRLAQRQARTADRGLWATCW